MGIVGLPIHKWEEGFQMGGTPQSNSRIPWIPESQEVGFEQDVRVGKVGVFVPPNMLVFTGVECSMRELGIVDIDIAWRASEVTVANFGYVKSC